MANAPTANEYIPNLVFLTEQFLLLEYRNVVSHFTIKNLYFPAPPEGVRPISERCSSGVNSNI